MIDLTVSDINGNRGMALWDEPCVPQLTGSGIALPPADGKKKRRFKVKKAEFLTMTKHFFRIYRLSMYSYLSDLLRSGDLRHLVGFDFQTTVINRQVLTIDSPTFWKDTRTEFEADVPFVLTLQTDVGPRRWNGCFLFSFCITGSEIIGLIDDCLPRDKARDEREKKDQTMLSPFLVPYHNGRMMDKAAEDIWRRYFDGEIPKEADRKAPELARRMGLTIQYEPIYDDAGVGSIIFFKEGKLLVKENGRPEDEKLEEKLIPAKTIVINTNIIKKEYSWFDIYHECYHYEMHYAFFALQQMGCNDLRGMEDMVIEVDEDEKTTNPIYWIETQANRGAYGLMMPMTEMLPLIRQELAKVINYRHRGELYEQAGMSLAYILHKPYFRIRARLVQLGHIHARGALNYVDGERLAPFDFDDDAWNTDNCTFIISRYHSGKIYEKNEDYRALLDTGKFIYADGHIVRNRPEYVTWKDGRHVLTDWAYQNVDQCCLRFMREYKLKNIGRYVLGRMNYDDAYVKQMRFYMSDIINKQQLELDEAKEEYIRTFPDNFRDAFNMLRKENHVSLEDCEGLLNVPISTLRRWLNAPEEYISIDFVMYISLLWKLPDFITNLLFDLASKSLSMRKPRHVLLSHIMRVEWEDGVDSANAHLKARGFEPLTF